MPLLGMSPWTLFPTVPFDAIDCIADLDFVLYNKAVGTVVHRFEIDIGLLLPRCPA